MEWAPQVSVEMMAQHRAYLQPMLWAFLIGSVLTFCQERHSAKRFESTVVIVGTGLTTAALALEWHRAYSYFIQHGGDPTYKLAFHAEDYAWTILCALCNIMLARRTNSVPWRSSQSWVFLGAALVFMLGELATALGVAISGILYGNDPARWVMIGQLSIALALLAVALDLITSAVLIVRIKRLMRTVDASRNRPFEALVRLACATGSLTALVAIIGAILYITVWATSNVSAVIAWLPFMARARNGARHSDSPEPSSNQGLRESRAPASLCARSVGAKLDTSAFERLTHAKSSRKDWPTSTVKDSTVEERKIGSCDDLEKAVSDYDQADQEPQERPKYESPFDKQALPKTRPVHKLPRTISLSSLRRASSTSIARHPAPVTVQQVMVKVDRQTVIE
ncbi:BQ2448_1819 [Microbotryum intermedium]|uniref:BQ2448_1819 protein n=1 Tax=Microbotryum intermedium TaxID=269621 RepID=A0A238FB44_9BASI|nr:BQ2448_1819 [Microbotryum intermedium]